jgi:hypothetical protein
MRNGERGEKSLDFWKKIKENPKTMGEDTYYHGRIIFSFHLDSNLALASTL